ncbi:MAG: hypothetical protein ACHQUC_05905 [Chlamydiales bacterium]
MNFNVNLTFDWGSGESPELSYSIEFSRNTDVKTTAVDYNDRSYTVTQRKGGKIALQWAGRIVPKSKESNEFEHKAKLFVQITKPLSQRSDFNYSVGAGCKKWGEIYVSGGIKFPFNLVGERIDQSCNIRLNRSFTLLPTNP